MSTVLELFQCRRADDETLSLDARPRVVYSVDDNVARFTTGPVELGPELGRHLLRYEFTDEPRIDSQISAELALDRDGEYLVRCDRVELPPGGIAYLHTHRGPGIRCLIQGRFRVEVDGFAQTVERYGAWFETGVDPVQARAVSEEPAAFVRVMVLPRELLGRRSIRYVRESDKDRPKPQRYEVFVDEPLVL
jgi:quercetin dioxygenase-like cupin family protein